MFITIVSPIITTITVTLVALFSIVSYYSHMNCCITTYI